MHAKINEPCLEKFRHYENPAILMLQLLLLRGGILPWWRCTRAMCKGTLPNSGEAIQTQERSSTKANLQDRLPTGRCIVSAWFWSKFLFQRKNRQSMTKFWMKSDQSQKNANQTMSNYRFCVMGWKLVEEQARNDKDKIFRLFYFMWMPQFVQVPCLKGFSPTSETGTCARWRCWHVFLAKTNSVRRAKTWLKQRARRTSRVTIPINLDFIAFQLCKMWYLKYPEITQWFKI